MDLRNQDGTQAFTPVPAIQTDRSKVGYISAMSDIECPDICGSGALITVYSLKPSSGNPLIPVLSAPKSVTVTSYTSPPSAPQKGTGNKLDSLDGRLTHSVSGIDPTSGKTAIWLAHTVLGGAGSMIQWYEIAAASSPLALLQTGTVSNANLYVLNAGISNDRTVPATGLPSHGSAMVLGFTTSSSTTYPADQMVSKIGAAAQSGFVLANQSATSTPISPVVRSAAGVTMAAPRQTLRPWLVPRTATCGSPTSGTQGRGRHGTGRRIPESSQ